MHLYNLTPQQVFPQQEACYWDSDGVFDGYHEPGHNTILGGKKV
jgi:hypothetical protein